MKKVLSRLINFGTSTSDEVNTTHLPVKYTPKNYTPIADEGEGDNALNAHLKGIDLRLASLVSIGFSEEVITGDGSSTYTVTDIFSSSTTIDVFVNGVWVRENKTSEMGWTRDENNNQVTILFDNVAKNISSSETITVFVYDSGWVNADDIVTSDGVNSSFTLSFTRKSTDNIQVMFNGLLMREDVDWEIVGSTLTIYDGGSPTVLPSNVEIMIRRYPSINVDEYFTNNSGPLQMNNINLADATNIDVYKDGVKGIQGTDYDLDLINNEVDLLGGGDHSALAMTVRAWYV